MNLNEVIEFLISERIRKGYSQGDVAEYLGVATPSISAFERHHTPDTHVGTIDRYADAIGYDLNMTLTKRKI